MTRQQIKRSQRSQRGFTLTEMLVAALVLVVGIVGVAQLVPVAIRLNSENQKDSTAVVIAQRELDAMFYQPLTGTLLSDPLGVLCPTTSTCDLGDSTQPNVLIGSPVVMYGVHPLIDFSQAQVANYGFFYSDPNDPLSAKYDIRWAVITFANGGTATGKRFIIGVRQQGGGSRFLPITLDTMVEK